MLTAVYRLIIGLALLLPLAAEAGDADYFVAANATEQARLLQAWAAQPDPARQTKQKTSL